MKEKRVVVVGGGVIGLCCAYAAVRRGMGVVVLERGARDSDSCSLGNAGMVVPSHVVPLAAPGMVAMGVKMLFEKGGPFCIRPRPSLELLRWGWAFVRSATAGHVKRCAPVLRDLHLLSRAGFIELGEQLGDFGMEERGLFALCKSPAALDEEAETAALARELGVPAEVLGAAAVKHFEPGVAMDVAGAVYFPKDCQMDPGRFVEALRRGIEDGGGEIRWGSDVASWEVEGGEVRSAVLWSGERVAGDEFVLAGGAWSPQTVVPLGLKLPMQAGKGYSVTVERPRVKLRVCSLLMEARVAVTPMGGKLRVGGTMEIAGLDRSVDPVRLRGILRALPRYYPGFREEDFAGLEVWSGLRPCSPDGMPYLGRSERHANLTVATGHAMMGLSLGPVTGRIVGELLAGDAPSVELGTMAVGRLSKKLKC